MNISEAKFSQQNENKSQRKNSEYGNKIEFQHVEDSRLHDTDIIAIGNDFGLKNTQDINLRLSNDGDSRVNLKNSHAYAKTEIGGKNLNNFGHA